MRSIAAYQLLFNIRNAMGSIIIEFKDGGQRIEIPGLSASTFTAMATMLQNGSIAYDPNTGWFSSSDVDSQPKIA